MLEKISALINKGLIQYGASSDKFQTTRTPNEILTTLEEEGMLPPIIKNPKVKEKTIQEWSTQKSLDNLYSRDTNRPDEFYVNQWDSEE